MTDSFGSNMYPIGGVPLAYGLAIALNRNVSDNRSDLTEAEKEKLIAESHSIKSKEKRDEFLNSLE